MNATDLDNLAARFQSCTISKPEWTHLVHLQVGAWHVQRFGSDEAVRQLRRGIRQLNEHHGTPNSDQRGYHETITVAHVRLISAYLDRAPKDFPFGTVVQELIKSELAAKDFLLKFYSRAVLASVRARREWIEPDIAPLTAGFQILRASGRRVTPWKNGCGWTAEIAVWPPGSTIDTFDWRISIAGTESDAAPFSLFAGVDRTLALLTGKIALAIDGQPIIEMTAKSPPVSFPGDVATHATLMEKPIMDFNVMTHRGRFSHKVSRRTLDQPTELIVDAGITLIVSLNDDLHLTDGSQSETLSSHDVALFEHSNTIVTFSPSTPAEIIVIEIHSQEH